MDKRIQELTLHDQAAQLNSLTQIVSASTLEEYLSNIMTLPPAGMPVLKKACPILFRSFYFLLARCIVKEDY